MRFIKTISASCLLLLSFIAVASMSACSDVGHFDANKIASIAKAYYNDKYGVHEEVSAVHQEISYDGLFGYHAVGNYYCTMSDGKSVKYDDSSNMCKDNRQQAEITRIMGEEIAKYLIPFENALDEAGYKWSWDEIDGSSPEERAYRMADNFAHVYFDTSRSDGAWERIHTELEEADFQASYFTTRYDGNTDDFLSQEFAGDHYGYFPTCSLWLSGSDIPTSAVFEYNQMPQWWEPANTFLSACKERFNGSGVFYFMNDDFASSSSRDVIELGDCSFGSQGLFWSMPNWKEFEDGIWLTFKSEDKNSKLELVDITDVDLAKYQKIGAFPLNEDISGIETMEVIARDIQADTDAGKWVSVSVGYDPSKYEIRAVDRDDLASAAEEMSQNNANKNNSVTELKPAYVKHADIVGSYGLLNVTAYPEPGNEKATILIVKKIG